jgi:hypothetical protein
MGNLFNVVQFFSSFDFKNPLVLLSIANIAIVSAYVASFIYYDKYLNKAHTQSLRLYQEHINTLKKMVEDKNKIILDSNKKMEEILEDYKKTLELSSNNYKCLEVSITNMMGTIRDYQLWSHIKQ